MNEPAPPPPRPPPRPAPPPPPRPGAIRERGGCLTMFLVVGVAVSVQLAVMGFGLVALPEGQANPDAPPWALPAAGLSGVINALLLVAIWFWQRWAVYAFCAVSVVITGVNLVTGGAPLQALAGLAAPFVLFLLTAQRWARFR